MLIAGRGVDVERSEGRVLWIEGVKREDVLRVRRVVADTVGGKERGARRSMKEWWE